MPPKNPLDIPEITSLIASYLEGKDLATSTCVSKTWYEAFLPHRWRVVHSEYQEDGYRITRQHGPNRKAISNHRHLIQDLALIGELHGAEELHYPDTRRLHVHLSCVYSMRNRLKVDIASLHPSLVSLELDSVDVPPAFWTTLSAHSHIKSLDWKHTGLTIPDPSVFWDVCKKLESLRMLGIIGSLGVVPKDVTFDRLRNLALMGVEGLHRADQIAFFLQSPNLRLLEWNCWTTRGPPIPAIPRDHWPHLNKLHVLGQLQGIEAESIFQGVGNSLSNIVDLKLDYPMWDMQTSNAIALHRHFGNLVKVDVAGCLGPSPATLDFLCHCPRLEVLHARAVYAKDIAERGPWVCQRLRVLSICFLVRGSDQGLRSIVFERLSTLVQLRELTMVMDFFNDSVDPVLEFRLDHGMGRLASLQQLVKLTFRGSIKYPDRRYIPQLELREVEWMVETWKSLKFIYGDLNFNREVAAELKRVIESYGINKKPK